MFQCSSASRKFLKSDAPLLTLPRACGFSALQRAENSSKKRRNRVSIWGIAFQCSSASRKFLKRFGISRCRARSKVSVLFSEPKIPQLKKCGDTEFDYASFSALQRAENSSMRADRIPEQAHRVFQCSSASRKFLNSGSPFLFGVCPAVSVLFSEPKIPQSAGFAPTDLSVARFQCSSASRKFLNGYVGGAG